MRYKLSDETKVYPNGQAVSVRMSHGATQTGDGLGYDIVPCFKLIPDNTNELDFYIIPDGFDGWLSTNPRVDAVIADNLHTANNKTYRKVVKLVKCWNSTQLNGSFGSYYIELAIARAFLTKNNSGEYIHSISHGLVVGLEAISKAAERGNQTAWITHAPPVEVGTSTVFGLFLVRNAATKAQSAWLYEQAGRIGEAIGAWGEIFGSSFPTP